MGMKPTCRGAPAGMQPTCRGISRDLGKKRPQRGIPKGLETDV